MRLVSIGTEEENDIIREGIRKCFFVNISSLKCVTCYSCVYPFTEAYEKLDAFWLSAADLGHDGDFYWDSTGKNLGSFNDWMDGEPAGNHHCAEMSINTNVNDKRRWKVADCFTKNRYVCESIPDSYKNLQLTNPSDNFENTEQDVNAKRFRFRSSIYELSDAKVRLFFY